MRLGLDARTLFADQRRGIGKSMLRLYSHLADARPGWEIVAYHRTPGPPPADLPRNFTPRFIEMRGDRFDAWTQVRLPAAARMDRVDALHCPANLCPRWMPVPTLVTIHDVIPLDMPQGRSSRELKRFELSVEHACQKAAAVVSPSHYVRGRLVGEHGLDPRRGLVVPWGPTLENHTIDITRAEAVVGKLGVTCPYLLHFGAGEERKNTRGVIEAWAMVRPRYRQNCRLLIVGLDDKTRQELGRLCDMLGLGKSIVLQGYVPESELPLLLSCATVLLYPSLSEGFGLPVLEAFASATPVITSDTTSLPEVAGGAAMLVPPGRATSLATAMTSLIKDPMRRAELAGRGTKRLRDYNWDKSAVDFARVCEAVGKLRRGRRTAA
ncbi:MAG: glycosyltransferase family 4 protein [Phycisphaerales bacterium JB063]